MTTSEAFNEFLRRIAPTEPQWVEVRSKKSSAEKALYGAFPATSNMPLHRLTLVGSAGRGTLIRPIDDLDVLAEFSNAQRVFETYRYDSQAFLGRIRRALSARTSIAEIGVRGQAVRLFYQQGAHVDIAPVFRWQSGGFALPSGDGGWITTDPLAQAQWFEERNRALGGNVRPLVMLLKRWNGLHSAHFQSYHLEVIAASAFASLGQNHRENLESFFSWAPPRLAVADPSGHSGRLDAYLSATARTALLARLANARDRATAARSAEARGDHAEAKRLWRIELGSDFPA